MRLGVSISSVRRLEVHGFTHTWSDPRLTDHAREYLATFGSYLVA